MDGVLALISALRLDGATKSDASLLELSGTTLAALDGGSTNSVS